MGGLIRFVGGAIVGAALGAIAGLLLAPSAGADIQRRMRARVEEVLEAGKQAVAAREAELQAEFERARKGATNTA